MAPHHPLGRADCGRSLPELLLSHLGQEPEAPAILAGTQVWSRARLDQEVLRLLGWLQAQGVARGSVVAIALPRGPQQIAAVLAVMRAGAACLPLDPSYPEARLKAMLAEAAPRLTLDEESLVAAAEAAPAASGTCLAEGDDLAYVIYTSGSTGRPKGVAMPHGPLLNLMAWQAQDRELGVAARTLQFAPLSFDVAFQEIFATLGSGGTLVLCEDRDRLDPARLLELLEREAITRLFLPAVALQELAQVGQAHGRHPAVLREVITAGEQLVVTPTLRAWFQGMPEARLVNQYGPSETHVATSFRLPADPGAWPELPPIGQALPGVELLVVDEDDTPVAEGAEGELLLGGLAPARGYLAQPEETAARFITREGEDGRWYRTGDLVRRDEAGELHFLGRADQQVKLRGYRIELGEVEAAIATFAGVGQAAVARQEGPCGPRLVAYVQAEDEELSLAALRRHLQDQLPAYMVPSAVLLLAEFPRTPSGKLDRQALPTPDRKRPRDLPPLVPPADRDEEVAVAVWREVLALDEVGVEDPFLDLGGDSLASMRMVQRLREQLGREVPVTLPYRAPTIRGLLRALKEEPATVRPARRRAGGDEAVAVVGMHLRVPGAEDLDAFWDLLTSGEDAIRHFSEEELRAAGVAEELLADPDYVRARGQVADATGFDAAFFGMSPREATLTDPQQRLFLEGCWAALESAGYAPRQVPGTVGVWGGMSTGMDNGTYLLRVLHARPGALGAADTLTAMIGNQNDYLCTRVSHKLDLHGPSVAVQTACSTSLVAIAQAVESLRAGGCDMALAGGVSVLFPQDQGYLHQEGDISSSDGRCRPFDAAADGTLFGDGIGVVALKRLSDAEADGDPIHAVIRGVAVNNDGAGRQSYSAPSPDGQAAVVAAALADAGWDPASVGMIEAHGTGTPIGDPIEVDGLRRVYGGLPQASCALGSVKSQVGHLIAAAGVTGFIKSVLALERGSLPPTAHFKTAHEALGLAGTPFFVPAGEQPWREQDGPRRAGVSAFGLGGTNAHVLLEQAPALPSSGTTPEALCLPLSAATPEALAVQAATLADHLEAHPEADAAAVAVTLQDGREAMRWRAAVGAADLGEAVAALRDPRLPRQELKAAAPTAAFLFPGGGAQDPTMGHGLIASEPTVRAVVEQGIAWMKEQGGPDLGRLWWPGDPGLDAAEAAALWRKPSWQLPAIYLLEVALARLWQEHGVEPRALLGHSMGEYAAACIAGVMSLEEGLGVVATRGRLFETLPEGGMLSVALPEAELRSRLGAELDLGVVNGEELCLASGPVAAIEALETALTGEGIDCARVRIEVAAHSRMVDAILDEFRAYLEGIDLKPPRIPIASNLSGDWLTDEEACSPDYWVRHLRETVRFADGLALVAGDGSTQLIEAGPGRTLSSLAKPALDLEQGQQAFASLGHADDARDDRVLWQEAVGRAWCAGLAPDWARLLPREGVRRLSLPTYAFARTPYLFAIPGGAPAVPDAPVADVAAAPAEEEAPAFDPDLPRLDRVRLRLAMILGQLSGMDPNGMPTDQPFLEMGFDSLFLTQASLAFKRAFGVKVTFRQLFNEAPDLDRLADYIDGELAPDAEVELPLASAVAAGGSTEAAPGQAMVLPALHPEGADPGDKVFRFRPFKPVEKGKDGGLTAQQQAHLDELIEAVTAKTPGSKAATAAHRSTFADPRAVGGFKTMWKEAVYPLHVTRSKGARMWDVDGNEYVDAVGGFGAVFFGHAPDFVVDAVREQAERNLDYGPTSMLAGRLSERFCAMTGMDRVGFCNTGSEAMLAAIRIARTVTGRDRVATFSGAYHGLFDQVLVRAQEADGKRRNVPVAPGIPQQASSNVMVLEYGLPASLELIRAHADELAAVLVEPVQSRAPEIQPFAFVKQLRALTEELGIPLVFDEVITGFRTHPRGAQHYYGVQADIAAYGKVIGGGLPIGMVAGRAEYLDALDGGPWQYGDDSFPEAGVTYFAGTFVRHPLALAAMDAVLDRLEEGGPELQEEVNHRIAGFCAACNDDFEAAGLPLRMLHYASMIYPKWGGDPEFEGLWFQHLRLRGVHIWEGRPGFLTTEHGQAELDFMREAFVAAAEALVEGGFLVREEPADAAEPLLVALTGPQEELWLTTRAAPEASIALNEPCAFRLDGRLHRGVLDRALRKLVERHDALRAAAAPDGSGLVVHPHGAPPPVREHDLRGLDPEEQAAARERIYREDSREPFDLEAPPLLRVHLIRLGEREQELLLTVHHLIADGWSISILFHDLAQLYSRMMQGRNETLEEAMPLTEFKAWEVEQRASVEHAETLAFWKGRFATVPEPLELPLDRPRPARRSYAGDRFHVTLEAELGRALQQQASTRKCTLFSLLLAGYLAWLHRLTGRTDLVLGIPSAGQALLGANNLVAHCVHYLPFRLQVDSEESFDSLVARVAEEMLAVNEHQDFTFGDLLQELRMPRDASRPTLISVDFNVDPALKGMDFHGLDADYVSTPRDFARLELQLNVIEEDGHLLLECDYATDILDRATAEQWMADYAALLREVAERPTGTVAALPGPMVARTEAPPSELAAPLDVGPFQGVVARVRAASTADPARIALVDGERKLDYGSLMAEVDAWTGALQDVGLEPGQVVALHLGRSLELTVAQLAVWQAGGVCLPLDPAHPLARRAELLERAAATLLVHGHDAPPEAELRAVTTFPIQIGAAPEAAMRAVALDPSMPAYILFTSGSTGTPKGVSIAHGSFDNLLPAFAARPGASADESWLAVITPTFDMSLVETFVPLTVGARVVLAPADRVLGGPELLALLRAESIDVIQATPATWRMLVDAGLDPEDGLRIIAGGEALTPALAEALRPCARELWNAYGPTEITVYACAARLDEVGATVPIGLPIANVGLHILGADDRPVAAGETGELCISGAGLALGYLDMPEETAERFPTLDLGRGPERLYRSGDLARLMPDGQVQCLGRNDDQVKLRGFRIELGEIEAALEALPAVAQAAVALRQDEAGEDLLAAWLRPVGEALPPITELRSALARRLPAVMIPARLHEVDDFPLTSSGKVDRKALVLPRREVAAAAEGEENMEDFLSRLWQAMLGLEELALDDDFFMLGGSSLQAARMLARVEERTGLLLALEEVFHHPTVRGLAATIEATLFQQESPGDGEGREELRL